MVRVLVAPDKFKGSLTAAEVCDAVREFFLPDKNIAVSMLPLADGGEGTFEILLNHFKGITHEKIVHDPLMRKIKAGYGLSLDGKTAFIEMARASGLQLLKHEERAPLVTSTFGTGELIADALEKDVTTLILGIGGSATNDAGVGMASALGYKFYDKAASLLDPKGGKDLIRIYRIDRSSVHPRLEKVNVITLCDVKNPLTGVNGAANIFAPQKGATPSDVKLLEDGMLHFENILRSTFNFSTAFEGAGAAGGLGAGARFFLNARLTKGMDFLSDATDLGRKISQNDIVITGEGKLDEQSLSGKVVQRVAALAKTANKKVIVLCGVLALEQAQLKDLGIDECLILSKDVEQQNAIQNAFSLIKARLGESTILRTL